MQDVINVQTMSVIVCKNIFSTFYIMVTSVSYIIV